MDKIISTSSNDYVLKIFSGLHQGAEVSLPIGRYKIGNSETCDIVLQDQGVAPEHVAISITESYISITAGDGVVVIEGNKLGSKEVLLEPFKIVRVGPIYVGVGFDGDDWMPDTLPEISDELETSNVSYTEKEKKVPLRWPQKIVFTSLFLPFMVAIFLILNSSYARDTKGSEKIINLFHKYNLAEPYITKKKNSGMKVVGYTQNEEQTIAIIKDIKKIENPITYNLYVESELIAKMNDVIKKFNFPVNAKYKGQGRFSLHGIVKQRWDVQKIILKLKEDIAGVREIVDNIWLEEDVLDSLKSAAMDNGLNGKITFEVDNGYFLARGILDGAENQRWKIIKNLSFQKYGRYLEIKDSIKVLKVNQSRAGIIKLPIKGVHIGELSYITLKNGKKYFEGGSLKSGYTIQSITSKRIVVLVNGKTYYCNI